MFEGVKVSHVLLFDAPNADNFPDYQEKTKRLSISGVQLKYSLRLEGKQLKLVETGGQYILKPIPPTALIVNTDQAPDNEHLTMQIASQLCRIRTAANALIYFKDGIPAYITRRFDVKPDGSKSLQEDMAQISGRTKHTAGENFKYEGTNEEIGQLIRKHVAAYPPALESFFRLVLFNYLRLLLNQKKLMKLAKFKPRFLFRYWRFFAHTDNSKFRSVTYKISITKLTKALKER